MEGLSIAFFATSTLLNEECAKFVDFDGFLKGLEFRVINANDGIIFDDDDFVVVLLDELVLVRQVVFEFIFELVEHLAPFA